MIINDIQKLKQEVEIEEGITLVALIITIVTLIILAAVTISVLFQNNFIEMAMQGTENYANAQGYEKEEMDNVSNKVNEAVNSISEIGRGEKEPDKEEPDMPSEWDSDKVYLYKSKDNVLVPVPIGFEVSDLEGEQSVKKGLVIKITQEEITSEFVWIPVENTSDMFEEVSGVSRGKLYNNGTSLISYDSRNYHEPDVVTAYDNTKSYYKDAGIKDKLGNIITTSDQFKKQLQEEFDAMKKSVETYKGFYIGRYETGNLKEAKAAVAKNNTDISNQNWYTIYQKSKMIVEGKSSMIWGCQWDAVMRWFLNSEDVETRTYVTNSSKKGNYNSKIIPTGSNDDYRVNNIYDMAGNVYDWTLEAYGDSVRTFRRWILV